MRRKPPQNQTPAWPYPKRKRHGITHEKVVAATEDFLSKGGKINVLPPSPDFRHMRNPVGLRCGDVYQVGMFEEGDILNLPENLRKILESDD